MASTAGPRGNTPQQEAIPFYRNVKVIGFLAQLIFVAVLIAGAVVLYLNVTTALRTANLPANFGFLDNRAGIPIAETPIRYDTSDPYWKAILVGLLNTLKIALVGVVLASLLGILVGVMRLVLELASAPNCRDVHRDSSQHAACGADYLLVHGCFFAAAAAHL